MLDGDSIRKNKGQKEKMIFFSFKALFSNKLNLKNFKYNEIVSISNWINEILMYVNYY